MKFRLILMVSFLFFSLSVYPGNQINSFRPDYLILNDSSNLTYSISDTFEGWIGGVYEKTIVSNMAYETGAAGLGQTSYYWSCFLYIEPGDSVSIRDWYGILDTVLYAAANISEVTWGMGGCGDYTYENYLNITIQYLSDSLQQYYLSHFDSDYIDSVQYAESVLNLLHGRQSVVYPNPTTGILNFTNYYMNNGLAEVKIYDITGVTVMQQSFTVNPGPQTNPVDMGNLPSGVYLVEYTVNGNRRVEKVVKM